MVYSIAWYLGGKLMERKHRERIDIAKLHAELTVYDAAKAESLLDRKGAHDALAWAKALTADDFVKGASFALGNARIYVSAER